MFWYWCCSVFVAPTLAGRLRRASCHSFVHPSFRPSVHIYPWCPVSATPLTVLYRSFWNFACIFFMVWECACGLDISVRSFCHFFPHCELSHFSPSIYTQWVPLVSATPLTVLYRSSWNFVCVFVKIWGWFGYNYLIISITFFLYIVNLVIFST